MIKHLVRIAFGAVVLGVALAACGGGGDPCDTLAKKLCEGKDEAYCAKTKTWLVSSMPGPDGQKLSSDEVSEACKMILSEEESITSYREEAARRVK